MHRSVEVQDLGVNLVACDDLKGCSGAPSAPWTGWHGHCHDGVHGEAPRGIDPASGGVLGACQLQHLAVPVALVAPLPHPAPHGWSRSRDIPEIPQLCPAGGLCSQHFHQDPPCRVPSLMARPHRETPRGLSRPSQPHSRPGDSWGIRVSGEHHKRRVPQRRARGCFPNPDARLSHE